MHQKSLRGDYVNHDADDRLCELVAGGVSRMTAIRPAQTTARLRAPLRICEDFASPEQDYDLRDTIFQRKDVGIEREVGL